MPRVDREAAVRRAGALHERERRVEILDVDVGRHELVDHLRVVVLGRVGAELGEGLGQPRQLARRAGDVPDLDVVRAERGGGVVEEALGRLGGAAALVVRIEEPLPDELELEVLEAVVVEQLLHVGQRARLQDVLEVGVPDPDPLEPDTLRLCAAVGEVEQAPLPAVVHLDRPGGGPVQAEEVVFGHVHAQT